MGDRKDIWMDAATCGVFRQCIADDKIPDDHHNLDKSFKAWLNDGHGVFHITGKLGSGKSHLMKLIDEYECNGTKSELEEWGSRHYKRQVLTASFYTRKSAHANKLQNQREGLIRNILYQILSQAPEVIEKGFHHYWSPDEFSLAKRSFRSSPDRHKLVLTARDVREALEAILKTSRCLQLFLLIDGLDEVADEGEHWELAKIVRS